MKKLLFRWSVYVVAVFFATLTPVLATELEDIYRLADEKKLNQAMERLEVFLEKNPRDAQARFLQGLIFTGKSKNDEAIRVFQALGEEFPDLPEPFNNLAVLYAERGEYEKARQALVNAIRILPNYATAHENLGDIYAKLASQAYAHALRVNNDNTYVNAKLELMKKLFVLPNTPAEESVSVSAPVEQPGEFEQAAFVEDPPAPASTVESASEETVPVEEVDDEVEAAEHALSARPADDRAGVSEEVNRAEKAAGAPDPAADKAQKMVEAGLRYATPSEVKDPAASMVPEVAVEQTVRAWAEAWSAQQVANYLAFYSESFQLPSKFSNRRDWERYRYRVIRKAPSIRVTLTNLKVTMLDEGNARVTFVQDYWSPQYQDQVGKKIDLRKEGSVWKFVREYE